MEENVQINVCLASANVLTLGGKRAHQLRGLLETGRIASLQAQINQEGIHILGLQECRTTHAHTRHSSSHWVYQSGSTPDGVRGCELWLDKTHAYASSSKHSFFFQHEHVHIAAFHDRYLMAVIKAPHFHVRILVTHAPHERATDCDIYEWWGHLSRWVEKVAPELPLIVLGDQNARLGTVSSDAVSTLAAEEETVTGHLLHSFALEHHLWIPYPVRFQTHTKGCLTRGCHRVAAHIALIIF